MEEMGNLPQWRKTGAEILWEEGQLGKQMREAAHRVKRIEKHIQELASNTTVEVEEEIVIADAFVD
ncbi:hypothetical protein HOY80DRAFT_1040709 [Tuber brumale]|nr:hypothetical protein HOY80DRAFT_1040709 [Tuber brumale]